ncbi:phytanoyl-CoA dioxygenase family protein [Neobacillus kokaensis]|uniref:Protein involved in biosynthesis of mitomycin antibiotics/polyketide fumonisin n=1 Tax=Neobacillus kokaensis TaxID=2759023 RepID=A0ABQ3NB23_9BACI|nr:phytanoyl-CoA dioxygenase family protein [Neobacillus kokaensis]GHI01110.1 protein involved in biosynthesis of mitomycin antibiotics/polyketide fumonisin [Neobacillus kokaensis]
MEFGLKALTAEQKAQFEKEGYFIAKGLFSEKEITELCHTFMEMSEGPIPGCFEPEMDPESEHTDPLKRYPRMMHPHRINEIARKYMLDPKVMDVLHDLLEEHALAAQSMFYFKPPGARGQALHQDNFYLQVEPGNCIAAWTAVDPADEENGGMLVVPKTHMDELYCPELADAKESFTRHFVKVPKGMKAVPAILDKGDVLFFNGNLIHGSYRNKSKDRFRRAFICHYAGESTTKIGQFYNPLYHADGSKIFIEGSKDSGPCGVEFDELYPH